MYWPEVQSSMFHYLLGINDPTVSLHFRDADFDQVVEDSLWLIGRQANNYVAVRRTCLDTVNGVRGCPIDSATAGQAWVCVVGDSTMYGSFSHFQTLVSQAQFTENWHHNGIDQWIYYASVTFDTTTVAHAWGRDSLLTSRPSPVATEAPAFHVYPNPVSAVNGHLSIEGNVPEAGLVTLRLMDLNGRILATRQLRHSGGSFHSEWELQNLSLATGMYGLEVRSANGYDFLRVLVQ